MFEAAAAANGHHSLHELLEPPPKTSACIEELRITDFALVNSQVIPFKRGLNVVTGESGSGKSVLVEALSQLLGSAAPDNCVRLPADKAIVEGVFVLGQHTAEAARELLQEVGLPQRALPPIGAPSCKLLLRREVTQGGGTNTRSRCFINGATTSLRVLRELGAMLVDSNGQHASMALRETSSQRALLDRVAGCAPLAASFAAQLSLVEALEVKLAVLRELEDSGERQKLQRIVDVVMKSKVYEGEEDELRAQLREMEGRRQAVEQCGLVRMAISGDSGSGGVADAIHTIEAQLHGVLAQEEKIAAAKLRQKQEIAAEEPEAAGAGDADDDQEAKVGLSFMEKALDHLAEARDSLSDAENLVKTYARKFNFSEMERDELRERLTKVEKLLRVQHCRSTPELLQAAADAEKRLEQYFEMEDQQVGWRAQLESLRSGLIRTGLELSRRRRAAVVPLRTAVERSLSDLAMSGSRFDVRLGWEPLALEKEEEDEQSPEDEGFEDDDDAADEASASGANIEFTTLRSMTVEELQEAACSNGSTAAVAVGRPQYTATECESLQVSHGLFIPDAQYLTLSPASASSPSKTSTSYSHNHNGNGSGAHSNGNGASRASANGVRAAQKAKQDGCAYRVHPHGFDGIEFLLAAGPNEPLRPLSAVASGGESARIMLALKAAPSHAEAASPAEVAALAADGLAVAAPPAASNGKAPARGAGNASGLAGSGNGRAGMAPIMILDELDSSIGARLGNSVGRILQRMSALPARETRRGIGGDGNDRAPSTSQIIAVTHLPQVACYAAHHIKVGKALSVDGRVTSGFSSLSSMEERQQEVAAMLGLDETVAAEMLNSAQASP